MQQRHAQRRRASLAVVLAALLGFTAPACVLAAGAVGGYLIYQETLPSKTQIAHVTFDVLDVWAVSQTVIGEMDSEDMVTRVEPLPRTIEAKVEKSEVTIEVAAYDVDRTSIRVSATRSGITNSDLRDRIMNKIIARLGTDL